MQVYNEERCLPCSLKGLLPVVDECVIVDGGPHGPSTDGTRDVIRTFEATYPSKIVYLANTYLREDLAWDEVRQVNDGISAVTGDYLMHTAADIVCDEGDVEQVREIVERFPDRKLFYCSIIDFGFDTNHVILPGYCEVDGCFPREICNPAPYVAVSMRSGFHAFEVGERRKFGTRADIDYKKDILLMPHVRRFHYGYTKPFRDQVEKYIRLIYKMDHSDYKRLLAAGERVMVEEAIQWASTLKDTLQLQPYAGLYPRNGEPLRDMNVMEGYEAFMQEFRGRYG